MGHLINASEVNEQALSYDVSSLWVAYWRSLIRGHDVPRASDLSIIEQNPRLSPFAIWLAVYENDFHVRVVGEAIRDLYGGGQAQQKFSNLKLGPAHSFLQKTLAKAVEERRIVCTVGHHAEDDMTRPTRLERLVMPFCDETAQITRLLVGYGLP